MATARHHRPGIAAARPWLVLAAALLLTAACATIEAPTGGPIDRTPPRLAAAAPGSASVGLRGVRKLELVFSEKVNPSPARSFLRTYPPLEFRKTRWHHRQAVTVELSDTLPGDTVVVVEVRPGLTDVHRVRSPRGWRWPLATADSLPAGFVTGSLALHGEPVPDGVVELLAAWPDTTSPGPLVLRRAETDSQGVFRLPWLPVPGGPWLLRAFADHNHDGRADEREPQRTFTDTLRLTAQMSRLQVGRRILFAPSDPGTLLVACPRRVPDGGPLLGWPEQIAESDTGFVPVPVTRPPRGLLAIAPGETTRWEGVGPGLVRLIAFVDLDGDSLLSAVAVDTASDTVAWRWEPLGVADSLAVEPGGATFGTLPPLPWQRPPAPAPAAPETTAATGTDTLSAAVDTTARDGEQEER